MRIFIKTIVTFFLLVLIIAIPIDYYLTHYFFKDWNNISQYQKDFWVLNQKDQELDIAILGTSRAFHVINPAIIKEINPKAKVVNYGTDGTSHADHYLYLYQLLQNNVKMDTLVLEVDEFTLSGWLTNTVPFKDYVFALKCHEEPFKQAYKDYFDRGKYFFWKLPLIRFVEYNSHYQLNPLNKYNGDRFSNNYGFIGASNKGFNRTYKKDSLQIKMHPFDIQYLNMIIKLAKKENIHIVLFTAPIEESFIKKEINRTKSILKIKEIASKHGVDYYDFSRVKGLKDTAYFSNETHLNAIGANRFTEHFYITINGK